MLVGKEAQMGSFDTTSILFSFSMFDQRRVGYLAQVPSPTPETGALSRRLLVGKPSSREVARAAHTGNPAFLKLAIATSNKNKLL